MYYVHFLLIMKLIKSIFKMELGFISYICLLNKLIIYYTILVPVY